MMGVIRRNIRLNNYLAIAAKEMGTCLMATCDRGKGSVMDELIHVPVWKSNFLNRKAEQEKYQNTQQQHGPNSPNTSFRDFSGL